MRARYLLLNLAAATVTLTPPGGAQVTSAPTRPEPSRADAGLQRLEREFARLATIAGGTVGVAVRHLETGREAHLNRGSAFPMASAFKVPVAVQLLTRVDRREIRLDSMITIQPGDLHPGSGTLSELFDDPGVVLSVRNLLELMLLISDNSATDVVLRVAGGPARVTERMRSLGVDGVRVDRPTVRLIADWVGVRITADEVSPDQWRELARATTDSSRRVAAEAFDSDPRDTSTPEGMTVLLTKVWGGEALSRESTTLLLDILRRVSTGADRLKGMLPPGTVVRHKTGTIGGTTNDVGIIELPDGAGNLAITVYVKGSTKDVPVRERAIAQIARAAYDYFLFNPGGT
jgi:beta-lactamase class A